MNSFYDWDFATHIRKEAIKRVKDCKNKEDFTTNNMCGFYEDEEKKYPKSKPIFCEVCQREIWFNNLMEEDLK